MGMIYVAGPYSHEVVGVRQNRAMVATAYASACWREGGFAFSPLTHNHGMAAIDPNFENVRRTRTQDIMKFDLAILEACDEIHILRLPGWRVSIGLREEMQFSKSASIRIHYVKMEQIELAVGWPMGYLEQMFGPEEQAKRVNSMGDLFNN